MSTREAEATGHMKRGFAWLGAASAITRVLDATFTLGVLWFVSREELGMATLAWSIGVFIEAFNGLGIGTAVVRAEHIDQDRLSDVFWYTLGVALLFVGGVWLLAPTLAHLWGAEELVPLIRASTVKLIFVGLALVPLQTLSRELRFDRIALANTLSTFGSGVVTLTLAWQGFGAWAFVLGQLAYGAVIACAAYALAPFRPRWTFDLQRAWPLIAFGVRAAGASIVYHLYRNADYFFMGRYLGVAAVGVYRVGFELAMAPTLTVLQVVNRAALPAYARLQTDRVALTRALCWTSKSLSLMLAPITALLAFGADDLLALVNDGEWSDAATVTAWLAWAALLRSIASLFPQVFYAIGRPQLALLEALASAVVLCAAFVAALALFGADYGILTVGWAWFAGGALLLVMLFKLTQRVVPLSLGALAESLAPATVGLLLLALLSALASYTIPDQTPPAWALAARIALLALGYAAFLRLGLQVRWRDLRASRA